MDFDVGARLRQVREAAGLSQRELARRAGVTNGTISLIEQNRNSPSVASLRKVLQGIPMDLSEFFASEIPAAEKITFTSDELIELANEEQRKSGGAISLKQVGDASKYGLQILRETYQPGADTGSDNASARLQRRRHRHQRTHRVDGGGREIHPERR